ncbi:MAG: Rieske 2Fe-2S domain-containing protein [Actinomycetota bacterium]|nr:Rieske 2Fe-2S domain-containing protein [Actinomycetota bacterium]
MSDGALILMATIVLLALAALFVFTTTSRRDRGAALQGGQHTSGEGDGERASPGREVERAAVIERQEDTAVAAAEAAPPVVRAPMDPEVLDVTRRQFMNRGITAFFGLGLAGFGTAAISFLWPSRSGGFGSKVNVGKVDEILDQINSKREPFYVPEARTWLATYPKDAVAKAEDVYTGAVLEGMKSGFVALYQKCVHLGCRVPWCAASQWFECPCHGSRYNRVGEKKGGPAPRGLDRFGVTVTGDSIVVDTQEVVQGPPIGVDTTGQGAEGPHCA